MNLIEILALVAVAALLMIGLEVYAIRNHLRRMERILEVVNESVYRKKYDGI